MIKSLLLLCLGTAWLGLGGCAGAPSPPTQADDPAPGTVFATDVGRILGMTELATRLNATQVLVVGEVHDQPSHHQIQLKMLEAMERPGQRLVVGVEWLDWRAQEACDRLSRGEVDVDEFARLADWETRWGFPLALYAPILERVRAQRHRLVALNAPVEVVRRVARHGLASLDPRERAWLAPVLDLNDPGYRTRMQEMARLHGLNDPTALENFFTAQVARDETMAWRLALSLMPWPDGQGRAVVLAGGGHLSDGHGLPPRIARLLPGVRLTTALPVPLEVIRESGRPSAAPGPADLLVAAAPAPPPPPRLGLALKLQPQGLLVERVFPASPAARAGFQMGDLLLSLDGSQLRQVKDIHDVIRQAPLGPHVFRLIREGREMEITVSLGGPDA